jgi:hypothetical protein
MAENTERPALRIRIVFGAAGMIGSVAEIG